ncbi:DUF2586 domain-containing protein [Flavobacterium sp. MC2016-06]|jgi:hypothetical protein|uniref:DUF2586 domain-containing protein n=1 Tax=Flavobacterium sp. MC2016-06 TaxID=2676308 RepID=UPI0012BACDE3|nr:DUF2586 domain-containing protein [Flavobacterium sp. MC2016-06]MBU3860114.1 DUF2586 domain-containing protein [Flavobacterium sp. MC2016-06]
MSTLNDVVITKLSGGLGRRTPEQDMVSGLLFDEGSGILSSLEFDKVQRLVSLEDAEALGITADFDNHQQSVYYQIQQFFRMNPSGDLYIMRTQAASYEDVVGKAMDMQEKANGNIRQMAIICSKATTFAQTQAAVAKAQTQAALAYTDYMPFEVILEGKGFDADTAPSLAELNAENVSVVVAMDLEKAVDYPNTAAVGLALGAVSKAKVSENIAWIEKFNLTGEGFAKAGFIGGQEIKTLGTLSELNDKRYIFTKTHTGLAGLYFNDSPTCTAGTSDFAYVENNRTINKATRLLRTALLPKLASPVLVDIDGKLPQSVSKSFEGLCRSALEAMVANQEVSAFDVYVDPKQNILATSELKVKAEITPIGTARKILVDLGFQNPFGIDKA